jgi:hypothetical protein
MATFDHDCKEKVTMKSFLADDKNKARDIEAFQPRMKINLKRREVSQ